MLESREHIELNSGAIERGYKSCRNSVRSFFRGQLWPAINLPSDQRRALDTILYNLMRALDLLDLESSDGRSLDVWYEIRDDLSDAFQDRCSSIELAALVDTSRRFAIPKQFLFDPLRGADLWIRNRKFESFEDLDLFCSYIGGSSLVSAMPVLGVVSPEFEVDAIECGKAIMLTHVLANCVNDIKRNRYLLAQRDLIECEVDIPRLKLRRPSKSFRHLVRLYVSRIEQMMRSSRHLGHHLDFDGQRSLKAVMATNWKMLLKMQVDPEIILSPEGVLSQREQLVLRSRHLMGIETKIPVFADEKSHH